MSQASKRRLNLALTLAAIGLVGLFPVGAEARRGFPHFVQPSVSIEERLSLAGEALFGAPSQSAAAAADAAVAPDCGWWEWLTTGCSNDPVEFTPPDPTGAAAAPASAGPSSRVDDYRVDDRTIERVTVRESGDSSAVRALLERVGLLEAQVSRFDGRIDAINGYSPKSARRSRAAAREETGASIAAAVSGGSSDASFGALEVTGAATSTFANGLDIADGCFAVDGVCIGSGGVSSQWDSVAGGVNYAGGNVGIGTTSPATALHVSSYANDILTLQSTIGGGGNTANLNFQTYETMSGIKPTASVSAIDDGAYSSAIAFLTKVPGAETNALAERVRITSDGKVGIGTADPGSLLDLGDGTFRMSGNSTLTGATGPEFANVANYGLQVSSLNYGFFASDGVTNRMTIDDSGNVGVGTTSPFTKFGVAGGAYIGGNLTATGTARVGLLSVVEGGGNTIFETIDSDLGGVVFRAIAPHAQTLTLKVRPTDGTVPAFYPSAGTMSIGSGNSAANLNVFGQLGLGTGDNTAVDVGIVRNASGVLRVSDGSSGYGTLIVGNVGVGTTTPSAKLAITSSGTGTGRAFAVANSDNVDRFTVLDNGQAVLKTDAAFYVSGSSGNTWIDQSNLNLNGYGGVYWPDYGVRMRAVAGAVLLMDVSSTAYKGFYAGDGGFSGTLGVGTTSPFTRLGVAGDAYIGGNLTATGTLAVTGGGSFGGNLSTAGLYLNNNWETTVTGGGGSSLDLKGVNVNFQWASNPVNSVTIATPYRRLGINNGSPAASLDIVGYGGADLLSIASSTGDSLLYVSRAGNVGVGTSTPGSLLSLGSLANFTTATSTFYSSGGINLAAGCFAVGGVCVGGSSSQWTTSGSDLYYATGNVGIGTTTAPTATLSLYGAAGTANIDFTSASSTLFTLGTDGDDSGNFKISTPSFGGNDVFIIASNVISTSYSNPGGTGNRTSLITVTDSGSILFSNNTSHLINGSNGNGDWFVAGALSGSNWIKFDFGAGHTKVIQEATYTQQTSATQGVWQWQGSNDDSSWTDIGSTFTLGGSTSDVITELSGNTVGYRYYRLVGVSGSTNAGPLVYQMDFKITESTGGLPYVGINDVHPSAALDVTGWGSGTSYTFRTQNASGATSLIVLDNGKVGVGTTSPAALLSVAGDVYATGTVKSASSYQNTGFSASYTGASGREYKVLSCYDCGSAGLGGLEVYDSTAGAARAYIAAGVNGWQTPSDLRLKSNVETLSVLDKLAAVRGVSYTLNDSGIPQIGVIAQEMREAFPQVVSGEESEGHYLGVNYNGVAAISLQGVKELNERMESIAAAKTAEGESFADRFFRRLSEWLADAGNGLAKIFAGRVETQSLCLAGADGATTCLTKEQLDGLLGAEPAPAEPADDSGESGAPEEPGDSPDGSAADEPAGAVSAEADAGEAGPSVDGAAEADAGEAVAPPDGEGDGAAQTSGSEVSADSPDGGDGGMGGADAVGSVDSGKGASSADGGSPEGSSASSSGDSGSSAGDSAGSDSTGDSPSAE